MTKPSHPSSTTSATADTVLARPEASNDPLVQSYLAAARVRLAQQHLRLIAAGCLFSCAGHAGARTDLGEAYLDLAVGVCPAYEYRDAFITTTSKARS